MKQNLNSRWLLLPITAFLFSVFSVSSAVAWGPVGHKTVGKIAEELLLPKTKIRVNDLLQGQSLAQVSIWADAVRQQDSWKFTAPYHYDNIHAGQTYLESLKVLSPDEQKRGGTVQAILESEKVFLDANSNAEEKSNAVKFIVHFIGDLHQPLHSGRPEDRGGNDIKLTWGQNKTNLHAVWDSQIMTYGHNEILQGSANAAEVAYTAYLRKHFASMAPDQAKLDDPNLWIQESTDMTADIYKFKDESPNQYTDRFIEDQDKRLFLAGLRLANFLNQMVMKESQPKVRMDLRAAIETITGSISNFISLRPQ